MGFSGYVHDKALTISDVSAKIDIRELANFLQSKKGINELNLINVEIDSKDVKELSKLTHLISLTLRNNKLGFEGAGYIGKSNLKNLTLLEISNNNIGDIGFAFLIGSKRLPNLTLLNVENNNIVGVWRHHYGGDIALKNLTSLYVEGNGKKFLNDKEVILDSIKKSSITEAPGHSRVKDGEGATKKLVAKRKKTIQAANSQSDPSSRLSIELSKQDGLREIVLDTETTGLDVNSHRIIEIGCVELINHIPTGKVFHRYINPERSIDKGAFKVHGISEEFLKDKPLFSEIASEFLNFISSDTLVIHNAGFDIKFLNMELGKLNAKLISSDRVLDTLPLARKKFGPPASLSALCERFGISLESRELHGALIDAELLAKVYVERLQTPLDRCQHAVRNLSLRGQLPSNEEVSEQLDEINVSVHEGVVDRRL